MNEQLKDTIAFTNSFALQANERLAAIENRLNRIEGKMDKEGTTNLDKTLQKHEEWLILIDKAIKEFRTQLSTLTNISAKATFKPDYKSWKFWK